MTTRSSFGASCQLLGIPGLSDMKEDYLAEENYKQAKIFMHYRQPMIVMPGFTENSQNYRRIVVSPLTLQRV